MLKSEQDFKQLYGYFSLISKISKLHINLHFWKANDEILQRAIIRHLPSAHIEGHIHMELDRIGLVGTKRLKESLTKGGINVAATGYLKISHSQFGTIFESKKTHVKH